MQQEPGLAYRKKYRYYYNHVVYSILTTAENQTSLCVTINDPNKGEYVNRSCGRWQVGSLETIPIT